MKREEGRVKNQIVRRGKEGKEGKEGKAMLPSCTEPNPRVFDSSLFVLHLNTK